MNFATLFSIFSHVPVIIAPFCLSLFFILVLFSCTFFADKSIRTVAVCWCRLLWRDKNCFRFVRHVFIRNIRDSAILQFNDSDLREELIYLVEINFCSSRPEYS